MTVLLHILAALCAPCLVLAGCALFGWANWEEESMSWTLADTLATTPRRRLELRARCQRRQEKRALRQARLTWMGRQLAQAWAHLPHGRPWR